MKINLEQQSGSCHLEYIAGMGFDTGRRWYYGRAVFAVSVCSTTSNITSEVSISFVQTSKS